MGYISKEGYERKAEWAARKNAESSATGIKNGLTEEQTEALERLCRDRHYLHTHKDSYFNSNSADYDTIGHLICGEIYSYLDEVGLENHLAWETLAEQLPNDATVWEDIEECPEDYPDEESKQDALDAGYQEVCDALEKVNSDIETFLREIDKEYGTEYCPTGASRIC